MPSLDDTYAELNGIYLDSNFYKDEFQIFTHLVEVVGGLSSVGSEKLDRLKQVRRYMPKAIAWWLALAGRVGVTSVEAMLWVKFPRCCPYCLQTPHQAGKCKAANPNLDTPNWQALHERGKVETRPSSISQWQEMFGSIYPAFGAPMQQAFARLTEELGELGEAIRVRRIAPSYFISEASDVFAWLMHVQNWYDLNSTTADGTLEDWIADAYPGACVECGQSTCACPAILDSAFGRMAHEVPIDLIPQSLIPVDDSLARFRQRTVVFKEMTWEIRPGDLKSLHDGIDELLKIGYVNHDLQGFQNEAILEILTKIGRMTSATAVTTETVQRLEEELGKLPNSTKQQLGDIASGIGTNLFSWLITMATTAGTGSLAGAR